MTEAPGGIRIVSDRLGDPAARAVVFLHGGGQTRRSWARAAAAVADRGWQAVTVDFRGHGESDWSSEGDYRVVTFAEDVREVLAQLPPDPVLVGASLGGFTSMLLAGELSPGIASAVVLVDIVPSMNPSGAERIHDFMADRMDRGLRLTRRGGRHDRRVQPAPAPAQRSEWLDAPTFVAAATGGTGTGIRSSSTALPPIRRSR